MEIPEHLPVGRLLNSTASLLDTVRGDANAVQQHLAEFIEALPTEIAAKLDMILLQSVDQLTQILDDLATALLAAAHSIDEGGMERWPSIIRELKLQKVRDALTYGSDVDGRQSQVELF